MNSITKKKPHYDLDKVKDKVRSGQAWISRNGREGAQELRLKDEQAIMEFMLTLDRGDFFKSITSNYNHREWQDVYKPMVGKIRGYVKFKVAGDVAILSFKKEDDR